MSCGDTPCAECHAGCCRAFAVPMTGADVVRLERAGHDFWEFACRWQDDSGAIARNYAPHLHFADEPQTPFVLCLLQHDSTTFPGTGCCRFLSESPGRDGERPTASCGVYEHRPAACRAFPFRFDEAREMVQLQPLQAPVRAKQSDVYQLCPRPWKADEVDGLETAQQLAGAEYEMSFFKKVAMLWNRNPGPWEAFPQFLRIVYSSRVNVEVAEEEISYRIDAYRNGADESDASRKAA